MKRLLFILFYILITLSFSTWVEAQSSNLDISLESNAVVSAEGIASGSITVDIHGRGSEFTLMLYDRSPLAGGKPLRSEIITNNSDFTFSNLEVGEYHVCVMDDDDNLACKKTEVLTD